jgi:hypothetical protein
VPLDPAERVELAQVKDFHRWLSTRS